MVIISSRSTPKAIPIAKFLEIPGSKFRHYRPKEVVRNIKNDLLDEIDLGLELKHLKRFQKQSKRIYIPRAFEVYCTSNLLVLEDLEGEALSDKDLSSIPPAEAFDLATSIFHESDEPPAWPCAERGCLTYPAH